MKLLYDLYEENSVINRNGLGVLSTSLKHTALEIIDIRGFWFFIYKRTYDKSLCWDEPIKFSM